MPLDPSALAPLIEAQLALEFTPSTSQATSYVPTEQWTQLATAIANAVIPYIIANAVVLPTSSSGGLISGAPSAPVTGTGSIS